MGDPEIHVDAQGRFPNVAGRCPACGSSSLFLGAGGWVTCSLDKCPNPTAWADAMEHGRLSPAPVLPEGMTADDLRRKGEVWGAIRPFLTRFERTYIDPETARAEADVLAVEIADAVAAALDAGAAPEPPPGDLADLARWARAEAFRQAGRPDPDAAPEPDGEDPSDDLEERLRRLADEWEASGADGPTTAWCAEGLRAALRETR